MNKRKILIIATLGSLLALGGTGLAMAHSDQHGKGMGKGEYGSCKSERGTHRGMDKIEGLSEAQREQLKAIAGSHREQGKAQREQHHAQREAMREAIARGASPQELEAMASEQAELHKQRILQRAERQQQMMAVLSEEQRAQMLQLREERMGKHQHGH
ncbi:MAG: Spy/CpxP family protein refolding chaperone [Thiohalomonadaceae bacterium]